MLDATSQVVPNATEPDANHLRCGSRRVADAASPRWAVAQTHPQAERWALANLERQGYQCFLPLVWVSRRDRATPTLRHRVQAPLFTSYLFVVVGSHWAPVAHTRGIRRLLLADGRPSLVDHHAIAAIQSALQAAEAFSAPSPLWKPGTPCSLVSGPFAGLPAVAISFANDIANVSLMFLGHLRTVSVPLDCLRARDE